MAPELEPSLETAPPIGSGPPPETGSTSPARGWLMLAIMSPLLGLSSIGTLLWAVSNRLDRWEIHPFVALIYAAFACTLLGSLGAWQRRKVSPKIEVPARPLRVLLWILSASIALWVWFPPTEIVVGWFTRQVSLLRFGG